MNNDVDEEDIHEVLSPLAREERRRLDGEQEDEEQQMEKSPKMISRALETYKNVLRENHLVDKVEEQYLGYFSSNIKFFTVLIPLSESNPMNHEEVEFLGKKMLQLLKHLEGKFSILGKTTLVGVSFESNVFEADSYLPIASKNRIKVKNIVEALTTLLQSHQLPTPIQKSEVKVTFKYFIPLSGSGKRKENQSRAGPSLKRARNEDDDDGSDNEDENISGAASRPKQTRSNIMINNVDRDCLPHAVYQIWMQYQTLKEKNPEANKMRRAAAKAKKSTAVYEEVEKMKKMAGIRKSRDFTSEDLELLQNTVFKDKVQLIAIAENQESPFYIGPFLGHKKHITVLLQYINGSGHFSGVRSLSALMKTHFYCTLCLVKGPCLSMHYNCPKLCRRCGQEECQKVEGEIRSQFSCVRCRISFQSKECLENHLKKGPQGGKSRCELTEICKKCGNSYYTNKRKHKCGESWCLICEGDRPKEHDCKMEKSQVKENNLSRKRFVYTFESMVDPATREHIPLLFIGLNYCPQCSATLPEDLKDAVKSRCDSCSMNTAVVINRFENGKRATNVVKEAVEWMFSADHKDFVGIAHNSSRHDSHLILNHIISVLKGSPDVVMNGSKVTYLKYKDVTLLDSHTYLKMSLEDVAKTFKIPTKRGGFPVGFIHPNNFDYVGAIPPLSCYNLYNKTPAEKEEFEYILDEKRKEGYQFDFAKELLKYGYKSVYILAKALDMFEQDFESITGVVIFKESSTPEAAAVKVFRRKHFDHKTTHIALDAPKSYYGKSSIISQKYLAWFEEENQVKVKRSSTTGEHKIKNYFVDGYVDPCSTFGNGLIIEFSGCHWHAHTCSDHGDLAVGKKSGETIRKADRTRLESLQEHHVVKIVTECQVNEMKKENQKMAVFFEEFKLLDIMDIVDSSCGRTEVFRLYVDNDQKQLRRVKVVDLYPFVMKNKKFPVGKPKVISRLHIIKHLPITKPDQIFWRGFVSCRILPPKQLKIPLLEMKVGEKRIAALCFTCASRGQARRSKPCTHSDRERSYTGSFTTAEVQKALQLGYVVTNVFQALHYENWSSTLFHSFVDSMISAKTYSAGWPEHVRTADDQDRFIEECGRYGIEVRDKNRFVHSPGVQLSANLALDHIMGKFANRKQFLNTKISNDPGEFWRCYQDKDFVLEDAWYFDGRFMGRFHNRTKELANMGIGSIHIAAHVYSYGRLYLYQLMEKIGADNMIQADTDSLTYLVPIGKTDPLANELGSFMGQCKNDLAGKMTRFVATGTKSFGYQEMLSDGQTQTKHKRSDVPLKMAEYATMEKIEEMGKRFRSLYNTRHLLPDGSTLPHGYRN